MCPTLTLPVALEGKVPDVILRQMLGYLDAPELYASTIHRECVVFGLLAPACLFGTAPL